MLRVIVSALATPSKATMSGCCCFVVVLRSRHRTTGTIKPRVASDISRFDKAPQSCGTFDRQIIPELVGAKLGIDATQQSAVVSNLHCCACRSHARQPRVVAVFRNELLFVTLHRE